MSTDTNLRGRLQDALTRRAAVAVTTVTSSTQAPTGGGIVAGEADVNNNFAAYGILGVTPLGTFRLSP